MKRFSIFFYVVIFSLLVGVPMNILAIEIFDIPGWWRILSAAVCSILSVWLVGSVIARVCRTKVIDEIDEKRKKRKNRKT